MFYCAVAFAHIKKESDKIFVIRNKNFFVDKAAYLVGIRPFHLGDLFFLQHKAVDINVFFNKINICIGTFFFSL